MWYFDVSIWCKVIGGEYMWLWFHPSRIWSDLQHPTIWRPFGSQQCGFIPGPWICGSQYQSNLGTWGSAVLGTANMADLQKLRKSKPRRARPQVLSVNKSKYKQVHSMAWSGEIHWDCNYHTMQYCGMCLSLNSSVLAYWVINTVVFWRWESPFFSCSQCVLYVLLLVNCTMDTQISWVSLKAEHRKWSTATDVICWFFCWFDRS
jgi:hypothetical protein